MSKKIIVKLRGMLTWHSDSYSLKNKRYTISERGLLNKVWHTFSVKDQILIILVMT